LKSNSGYTSQLPDLAGPWIKHKEIKQGKGTAKNFKVIMENKNILIPKQ
jgi:hypothetical protein